ncbi:MAG: hypothetical protein DRJ56_08550 [Thermoprotei archaeon]|nr:MAG: hypothetical protein DRJ56_08550 [Thermoprotei archaeon]
MAARLLYNFRGVANRDLTPDLALRIGRAAADLFSRADVAVACDFRTSSPMLKSALVAGLLSGGCSVTDYGVLPTPVLAYLTKVRHGGGAMVTASHNPPEWNGIKLFREDGTVFGPEEEGRIREAVEGQLSYADWRELRGVEACGEGVDIYLRDVVERVELGGRRLKVVVDAGGGIASVVVPRMLREMGCEVVELFCEPDPLFKGRDPEPRPECLGELARAVRESGADVGFAYDGDADRIVVYDERGEYVPGNLCMIFLADTFVEDGSTLVVNVGALFGARLALGGRFRIVAERWGQTFIQRRMREVGAAFGGEPDGHYMWPGFLQSYADAIFSTAKVVEALSKADKPLSELLSEYPSLHLVRVKSEPWSGSLPDIRNEILAFMEERADVVRGDIDTHILYAETDTYGLTVRQSHWDRTVRIEVEALDLEEAWRVVREAYEVLRPKGVVVPELERGA